MATRLAYTLLALMACCHCAAQLTIEECYAKARDNYPEVKQYGLIAKAEAYNISNAAKGYLPQLALSAQATYQSDVTKLPFDEGLLAPLGIDIPTLGKDQYKVTLDMSQAIWDGGGTRARKKAIRAGAEAERRQADVSLYALRARVNQLFFGILLIEAQIEQSQLLQGELQRNCNRVKAYIDGGVANTADLDALSVELLRARQDEAQLIHSRRAYAAMLSQLTGITLADSTRLERPKATPTEATAAINRPELALYDAQLGSLKAEDAGITATIMPLRHGRIRQARARHAGGQGAPFRHRRAAAAVEHRQPLHTARQPQARGGRHGAGGEQPQHVHLQHTDGGHRAARGHKPPRKPA